MSDIPVRRGQIWYADLPDEEIGSVQSGRRPVLVTQSDRLNRNSTTVVVAIITSRLKRIDDPAHVVLPIMKGLPLQSMVEAEQKPLIVKILRGQMSILSLKDFLMRVNMLLQGSQHLLHFIHQRLLLMLCMKQYQPWALLMVIFWSLPAELGIS